MNWEFPQKFESCWWKVAIHLKSQLQINILTVSVNLRHPAAVCSTNLNFPNDQNKPLLSQSSSTVHCVLYMNRIIYRCFNSTYSIYKLYNNYNFSVMASLRDKLVLFHSPLAKWSPYSVTHHSLVLSLRGRVRRNHSPDIWQTWLWHTASWSSFWG